MAGKSPVRADAEQRSALVALSHSRDRGEADRARAILLTLSGWTRACSTLNLRTGIAFCPSWMRRSHADGHAMDEAGAAARGVPAQGQDPAPGSAAHDVGQPRAASERGPVARHPG